MGKTSVMSNASDPAKIVSHSVVVNAPANVIFDLLADPRRHHEIDGSGSVQGANDNAPARLSLGANFGMSMKIGAPYKITNTVVEFEDNARIAWRHFGGHIWRYILEPVTDGTGSGASTKVTEQFDWNGSRSQLLMRVMQYPRKNGESIKKTLANLQKKFA